jgi:CBS domain-containing protein
VLAAVQQVSVADVLTRALGAPEWERLDTVLDRWAPGDDIVPVITAMQALGTPLVAVTHQGRFLGIVTAEDVNRAVERV